MSRGGLVVALWAALAPVARADADEEAVVKFVTECEGRYVRDHSLPGKPVVEVALGTVPERVGGYRLKEGHIERLAALKHLKVLHLSGSSVSRTRVKELAALEGLTELRLTATFLPGGGYAALADVPGLRVLRIDDRLAPKDVTDLLAIPGLRELYLPGQRQRDAVLAQLPAFDRLTRLEMGDPEWRDDDVKALASAKVTNLTHLRLLAARRVSNESVPHLAVLAGLTHLDLSGTRSVWKVTEVLANFKKLTHLNLRDTDLGGDLKFLAELTNLTELDLSATFSNDLTAVAGLKKLRVLRLARVPVFDADIRHLADLTELDELNLSGARVTEDGLFGLKRLKRLKKLDLTGAPCGGGFAHLAGLEHLAHLTYGSDLEWDARDAKDVAALPALRDLAARGPVTDGDLKHFATAKQLRALRVIDSKSVTDSGLEALAASKSLSHLDVTAPAVTDDGLKALAQLKPLARLDLRAPRDGSGRAGVSRGAPGRRTGVEPLKPLCACAVPRACR